MNFKVVYKLFLDDFLYADLNFDTYEIIFCSLNPVKMQQITMLYYLLDNAESRYCKVLIFVPVKGSLLF